MLGGISNAIRLDVSEDGKLYTMIRSQDSGIEFETDLYVRDGQWHDVKYTYDNSIDRVSIWLDGNLHEYEVNDIEGSISDPSKTFWIGRHHHTQYPQYFEGFVNNVKIWEVYRKNSNEF